MDYEENAVDENTNEDVLGYYGPNNFLDKDLSEKDKRVLPYILHKRMPYIVHKRMPYIVHKKMMPEDMGRAEIARFLERYSPRTLRMIPLIH